MNFALSEEQQAIREAIERICARFPDEYWLKKDKEGGFPSELHQALAKDGWLGIAMPEAYGGSGLGITEAAVMMQAIAESGAVDLVCPAVERQSLSSALARIPGLPVARDVLRIYGDVSGVVRYRGEFRARIELREARQ